MNIKEQRKAYKEAYEKLASGNIYNGAEYRGAIIPKAKKDAINQINLPDNMRVKDLYLKNTKEGILLAYLCQDSYNSEDLNQFKKEIRKFIRNRLKGFENHVNVILHVANRNNNNIDIFKVVHKAKIN